MFTIWILAHCSDDVEWSPPVTRLTGRSEGTLRGKAALRDYFARGLQAYPVLRFDFIRLYPWTCGWVVEYRSVDNLLSAELMEFDAQGKAPRVLVHHSDGAS